MGGATGGKSVVTVVTTPACINVSGQIYSLCRSRRLSGGKERGVREK